MTTHEVQIVELITQITFLVLQINNWFIDCLEHDCKYYAQLTDFLKNIVAQS